MPGDHLVPAPTMIDSAEPAAAARRPSGSIARPL